MSTRVVNITKKKLNFEEETTPNVHEEIPIMFDYPFKSKKSKD